MVLEALRLNQNVLLTPIRDVNGVNLINEQSGITRQYSGLVVFLWSVFVFIPHGLKRYLDAQRTVTLKIQIS